uniref:NADH-ubiquinone oxidoreductase chain 2 n=1 Tax=Dinocampus coccinellae TaxID=144245 RepID=A0A343YVC2_9HYME|nr:NADH dehydrogenase subunit 2 [Dinocampus coccinellae]
MNNTKYNLILLILLFILPLMVSSSVSIISMWIIMELNTLIFITFLIMNNMDIYCNMMKYYIIMVFSSLIFIFVIMLYTLKNNNLFLYLLFMILMVKLGMFPFHYWFIDLMQNLNWISSLILLTWQKLIPLIITFYFDMNFLYIIVIIFSGLISLVYVFNQMMLKNILAYSSINHMCWMILILMMKNVLWMVYFLIYLILSFTLILIMNKYDLMYINDLMKVDFLMKYYYLLVFISLGSIPPMFGFMMKWLSMLNMLKYELYMMNFYLLFYSLMFLYYYMRIVTMVMLLNYLELKIYILKKLSIYDHIFFVLSMFSLFLILYEFFI